jgi:hypothetical protein
VQAEDLAVLSDRPTPTAVAADALPGSCSSPVSVPLRLCTAIVEIDRDCSRIALGSRFSQGDVLWNETANQAKYANKRRISGSAGLRTVPPLRWAGLWVRPRKPHSLASIPLPRPLCTVFCTFRGFRRGICALADRSNGSSGTICVSRIWDQLLVRCEVGAVPGLNRWPSGSGLFLLGRKGVWHVGRATKSVYGLPASNLHDLGPKNSLLGTTAAGSAPM